MADVSDLQLAIRARAVELARGAGEDVLQETQSAAPLVTGNLRNTHEVSPPIDLGDVVSTTLSAEAPYAGAVATGARAHEIRPRQAAALRFIMNGRVVFARVVQHPGNQSNTAWWSPSVLADRWRSALERRSS